MHLVTHNIGTILLFVPLYLFIACYIVKKIYHQFNSGILREDNNSNE